MNRLTQNIMREYVIINNTEVNYNEEAYMHYLKTVNYRGTTTETWQDSRNEA